MQEKESQKVYIPGFPSTIKAAKTNVDKYLAKQHLGEATYEGDAKARAEANHIWDSIVSYVKGLDGDYDSVVWTRDGMMTIYPAHTKVPYGMKVYLGVRGANSGYGSGAHGHVIVVGDVLMHPHDTTYLDTRIGGPKTRAVFVHEYIHHLDHMKRGKLANRSAQKAGLAGDMKSYLRNPEEFNAQFQETAQLIEDEFESKLRLIEKFLHMGKPAMSERTLKWLHQQFATFRSFMTSAEKHNEMDVIMRAIKGTKWERKWLKRMTTLYHALKPRIPSRLAVAQ